MMGMCWVPEQQLASQEGLSSMELVSLERIIRPNLWLLTEWFFVYLTTRFQLHTLSSAGNANDELEGLQKEATTPYSRIQ
jgi:hypothetical protein